MTMPATAARDTRSLVLARLPVDSAAQQGAKSSVPSVWRRILFWPLEFVRLVAAVYMLPLAILAIGIPVGLALTGVFLATAWVWRTLW